MRFAGYAALFDRRDAGRDTIRHGAFAASLASRRDPLPLYWQHRPEQRVGWIEQVGEDARGLRVIGSIDNPTAVDQLLGTGDGSATGFALIKQYGDPSNEPQLRRITRPDPASLRVSVDGVETSDGWTLDGGTVVFDEAPADGAEIRAGFVFDVPVRFADDRLDIAGAAFAAGEAPSVGVVEIREAA